MLGRGVTLFKVRGIPIVLDISLLFLLPYLVFVGTYQYSAIAAALNVPKPLSVLPPFAWGLLLALGLLASVLLHELAHTLVAVRSGARIRSITLLMLGGITHIDKEARPEREALMAFVGPLTSFGLALIGYGIYRVLPPASGIGIAVLVFANMNAFLGAFNLLPAFPMDGGRMLRGLLAPRVGRDKATRLATNLGKGLAVAMGIFGLLSFNVLLLFIAFFVYMGASAERVRVEMRDALHGLHVTEFMNHRLGEARLYDPASEVARRLLAMDLVGARVMADDHVPGAEVIPGHEGKTLGVVTTLDLAARAAHGQATVVKDALRTDLPRVHAADEATDALEALADAGGDTLVVLDEAEEVVGVVTPSDVQRAVLFSELGNSRSHHPDHNQPPSRW